MKKFITILLALLLVFVAVGWAEDIKPVNTAWYLFGDTAVTIIPNDTVYTGWSQNPGDYSEMTIAWAWEGDGSGSVDTLKWEFQRCWFTDHTGYTDAPDTTYAEPWDTLVLAVDSIGHYCMWNNGTDGHVNAPWLRARAINNDGDTCTLNEAKAQLAGSQ